MGTIPLMVKTVSAQMTRRQNEIAAPGFSIISSGVGSTIQTSDTALVLCEPETCVCWRQEKLESGDRLRRVPLLSSS